jgi:hypothetical protein
VISITHSARALNYGVVEEQGCVERDIHPMGDMMSWAAMNHGCWSDRELHAIQRIRDACRAVAALEWEGGHSDEGDPWCIIHDPECKQVILHIARIDRHYVVVCPDRSHVYRISYLTAAVETALRELNRAGLRCNGKAA